MISRRELILALGAAMMKPGLGWVEAGGMMSYGFNFPTMWRRGAEMVAAVLRGAKASEIPMEQRASSNSL